MLVHLRVFSVDWKLGFCEDPWVRALQLVQHLRGKLRVNADVAHAINVTPLRSTTMCCAMDEVQLTRGLQHATPLICMLLNALRKRSRTYNFGFGAAMCSGTSRRYNLQGRMAYPNTPLGPVDPGVNLPQEGQP